MQINHYEVPECLLEYSEIQNILANDNDYTKQDIEHVQSFIQSHFNLGTSEFITLCRLKPKKVHENVKLFSYLDEKTQEYIIKSANPFFQQQVVQKFPQYEKYVDKSIFTILEDIETFFYDDLNAFQNKLYMKRIKDITNDKETFPLCNYKIDLAAYLGSTKIFNFLFKSGSDILSIDAALAGGSQQIIQRLIQNGYKIQNPTVCISHCQSRIFAKFFWYSAIKNPTYISIQDIYKFNFFNLTVPYFKHFIEDQLDEYLEELTFRSEDIFTLFLECNDQPFSEMIMNAWNFANVTDINPLFKRCIEKSESYFSESFLSSVFVNVNLLDNELVQQCIQKFPHTKEIIDIRANDTCEFPINLYDYKRNFDKYMETKNFELIASQLGEPYIEHDDYFAILERFFENPEFSLPDVKLSDNLINKLPLYPLFALSLKIPFDKRIFDIFVEQGYENLNESDFLNSLITCKQFNENFEYKFILKYVNHFNFIPYFKKRRFTIEERKMLTAKAVNTHSRYLIEWIVHDDDMKFHINIRMFDIGSEFSKTDAMEDFEYYLKNVSLQEDEINYLRKNHPNLLEIIIVNLDNREKMTSLDIVKSTPLELLGDYLEDHIICSKSAKLIADQLNAQNIVNNKIVWRREIYPYVEIDLLILMFIETKSPLILAEMFRRKLSSEQEMKIIDAISMDSDEDLGEIKTLREFASENAAVEILFKTGIDIFKNDYVPSEEVIKRAVESKNADVFKKLMNHVKDKSILEKIKSENESFAEFISSADLN